MEDIPTRQESLEKSFLYRIYATLVTTLVAYFVFYADFDKLTTFFVADIFMGIATFYTFDRAWHVLQN